MSGTALVPALQIALSGLLGSVFVVAALPKLRHPKGFLLAVMEYRILPDRLSRIYARLVPTLELLASMLLFAGLAVRAAALLLALLALSFAIGVGTNLRRGRDLDCGCFGNDVGKGKTRRIGPGVLLQDVGLLGAALVLIATTRQWTELAPWSPARLTSAPVAGALLFLACMAAAVAAPMALQRVGARSGRRRSGQLAKIAWIGKVARMGKIARIARVGQR